MPDLAIEFCGVKAPNPFWLASAPPTNSEYQVRRAFDAGWGGAVWKTLGHEPIVNVSSRYGGDRLRRPKGDGPQQYRADHRPARSRSTCRRSRGSRRRIPTHALFVSLMVESNREAWHEITKRTQDAGADGIELNFGCPHGMSERGMGSAVGQVPDYACMITEWVKEVATIPVMVKLTPERHRRGRDRPGGGRGRGRCALADQHHQLDHGRRPRHARAEAGGRAAKAATAATAGRPSSRSR